MLSIGKIIPLRKYAKKGINATVYIIKSVNQRAILQRNKIPDMTNNEKIRGKTNHKRLDLDSMRNFPMVNIITQAKSQIIMTVNFFLNELLEWNFVNILFSFIYYCYIITDKTVIILF